MLRLENPIRDYAWGSKTAIPEILGRANPSGTPQAELWIGAHPSAPSRVADDGRSLGELIAANPVAMLGGRCAERFGGRLPFLLKILAAAEPLSIQAHPDAGQARAGYARENAAGIQLDSPKRNYKDDNHKPELICALTEFEALNGFRPTPEVVELLRGLDAPSLREPRSILERAGLREFLRHLLTSSEVERRRIVDEAVAGAAARSGVPEYERLRLLAGYYPGDASVLCAILLNFVRLEPGQAMFLGARQLHSYLGGTGIELMASSDNVLRGGLTEKHIDVSELMEVLDFEPAEPAIVEPREAGPVLRVYDTPASEFALSRIDVRAGFDFVAPDERSIELLLCVEGAAVCSGAGAGARLDLARGQAVLVPAGAPTYRVRGTARIFRASVPDA